MCNSTLKTEKKSIATDIIKLQLWKTKGKGNCSPSLVNDLVSVGHFLEALFKPVCL